MEIKAFRGLNNVSDPLRLGMDWLVQADNVDITDTGALVSRSGYSQAQAGAFTAAYSTLDFQRCYVVKAGVLQTFEGVPLATLTSGATMYWTEINGQVFYNNGTDSGVILPDQTVLPWSWPEPTAPALAAQSGNLPSGVYLVRCTFVLPDGRETGTGDPAEITLAAVTQTAPGQMQMSANSLSITNIPQVQGWRTNVYICPANSTVFQLAATTNSTSISFNASPDTLGRDLVNAFLDPLPRGCEVVQHWKGAIYAAMYMPSQDQTVIWFSKPLAFHLFNLNSNFIQVPGRVQMMAPTDDALIVGSASRIYTYDGKSLSEVAQYGVVPGQHWSLDEQADGTKRTLFWSTRGLCAALPFSNLTERQVSVPPGIKAGGTIVRSGGQKRYLVALAQGGVAFNSYT